MEEEEDFKNMRCSESGQIRVETFKKTFIIGLSSNNQQSLNPASSKNKSIQQIHNRLSRYTASLNICPTELLNSAHLTPREQWHSSKFAK